MWYIITNAMSHVLPVMRVRTVWHHVTTICVLTLNRTRWGFFLNKFESVESLVQLNELSVIKKPTTIQQSQPCAKSQECCLIITSNKASSKKGSTSINCLCDKVRPMSSSSNKFESADSSVQPNWASLCLKQCILSPIILWGAHCENLRENVILRKILIMCTDV